MTRVLMVLGLFLLLTAAAPHVEPQGLIREPQTGIEFPKNVSFQYAGKDYSLSSTGTAVRMKFFFKVYGMVHYMDEAGEAKQPTLQKALEEIMADNTAKQMTIEYVREVDGNKIQSALRNGFQRNSTPSEYQEVLPLVDELCESFNQPVKKNTQFILRWLPGGTIIYLLNGEQKAVIQNPLFARILWAIWLGDKSVVDRNQLVRMLTPGKQLHD